MSVAIASPSLWRGAGALERRLRAARRSFTDFVALCARTDQGEPFRLEPLHLIWHRHVQWCWDNGLNAGILAPMGHGKSAGLVVPLPAWLLGRNPRLRIKIVCSSQELAVDRTRAIKELIESPAYQSVFPGVRPGNPWGQAEIVVQRGMGLVDPSLQAKGVITKGVGKRADIILFDDVVDQMNSLEPGQRTKVTRVVSSTWMTRLTPTGRALWIATPWTTDDATADMMRRPGWCFLVQRCREDLNGLENEVFNARPGYPLA